MSAWDLPTSLIINNTSYRIRTDFRAVLDILTALNDPDLFEPDSDEKERSLVRYMIVTEILFEDYEKLPAEHAEETLQKAADFIDCGIKGSDQEKPCLMDWEQDAPLMIPAINRVWGKDVRSMEYMHWWTFLGCYMEISSDSVFSQVLQIRNKKARHRRLEKWEKEFYKLNKSMIDLKRGNGDAEALKELYALWGG